LAALIARDTGVEPEVVEGARGEFSIRVEDEVVARKDARGFPDEDDVLRQVKRALAR
jgi:predicted Rdx family selenoprotein